MSINLSRIYTRSGDKGQTSLVGGSRVSKGSTKLESYGTADELISHLGMLRTLMESNEQIKDPWVIPALKRIQNELFDIGSLLASESGASWEGMPQIDKSQVSQQEEEMDLMNQELPSLKSFVLPGGNMLNAQAHLARTCCRRLERLMVRLSDEEQLRPNSLAFVNRLSDWLFVFSRWVSVRQETPEYLWEQG